MSFDIAKKALEALDFGYEFERVFEATSDSVTVGGVTIFFQGATHEAKNFGSIDSDAAGVGQYEFEFEGERFDFDDVINAADAKTLNWIQGVLAHFEDVVDVYNEDMRMDEVGRAMSDSEAMSIDADALVSTLYRDDARFLSCTLATVGSRTLVITEGFEFPTIRYLLTESETAELNEKLEAAWVKRGPSDWDQAVIRITRAFLKENRETAW